MKVYLLLDRSGSMSPNWNEAIGAINGYAEKVSKEADIYMAVFDSNGYDIVRDSQAGNWSPVLPNEFSPRGMTPLYDSFGTMSDVALDRNDPTTVLVVMTDGRENASREWNQASVKARIRDFEDNKKWPVIFLGADFDVKASYDQVMDANVKLSSYSMRSGTYGQSLNSLAESTMSFAKTKSRSDLYAP